MNIEIRKIHRNSGENLETRTTSSGNYTFGLVKTVYGFVRVYAQEDFYSLEFIWKGKSYCVDSKCNKLLSSRSLTYRASSFVKRIVQID